MKFYLDQTTGKWVVGIYTGVPAGSCTEFTNTNGKIRIEKLSGGVIMNTAGEYDFLPTEFKDKDGNNYASLAAYKAATNEFFSTRAAIAVGEYDAVLSDTVELAKAGWIQPTLLGGTIKYVTVKGETRTRTFEKGEVSVVKVRQIFSTGTTANLGIVVYYE